MGQVFLSGQTGGASPEYLGNGTAFQYYGGNWVFYGICSISAGGTSKIDLAVYGEGYYILTFSYYYSGANYIMDEVGHQNSVPVTSSARGTLDGNNDIVNQTTIFKVIKENGNYSVYNAANDQLLLSGISRYLYHICSGYGSTTSYSVSVISL